MSAEARYFRVGLFVLLGAVLAGSCVVVLGGGRLFQRTVLAETYFDESVQGLQVGSPIRLRGVQIGQVALIDFVDRHYSFETQEDKDKFSQWVYVRMEITPTDQREVDLTLRERESGLQAWINEGFRLRLTTQALTGTGFIQGDFVDPERNPPLEISWQPELLYVPSAPSTMRTLTTAAERIFQRLEDVKIEDVVLNLDKLLLTLNGKVEALDVEALQGEGTKLLADLRQTLDAADIDGLTADVREALREAEVGDLSRQMRETLAAADSAVGHLQHTLDGSRFDFQLALENLRVTSENLRTLSETLRDYPSLLLLGEPPPPSKKLDP